MDVSIIIVNYKTAGLIADCVESIIRKTFDLEYEVIILDNDSEPDFEEIISTRIPEDYKNKFKFIALDENIGFGRANNEGLKYSSGRNILFLNPDTVILNNAIKTLSDFLDSHDNAGACGANILGEDMKPAQSFQRFLPGIFYEINNLFHDLPQKFLYRENIIYNNTGSPMSVSLIIGADLMVKRSVIEKVGAFCDEYFMYYDETDLCARIKRAGYEIFNVPDALIQHLEGKSLSEDQKWIDERRPRLHEESKRIFYRRNLGAIERRLATFIYRLFLDSRILLIKNPPKKNYYRFRKKSFFSKR